MYNDQLVYKVVIWASFAISLWKEKVALANVLRIQSWTLKMLQSAYKKYH